MPLKDLAEQKRCFLKRFSTIEDSDLARRLALQDAVKSAAQHNSLYAPGTLEGVRADVVREWKRLLESLASEYVKPVEASQYEKDVLRLQSLMNERCGRFFRKDRHPKFNYDPDFRVSHAQKSLSLILKHHWCLDIIAMPPQCPVDRWVLWQAGADQQARRWTYVNLIEDHREKIALLAEAARAEDLTLAEWELKVFNAQGANNR